jgi:hypothetical protein
MSAVKTDERISKTSARMASGQVLDSPGAGNGSNPYSYALREIMAEMRLAATMAGFETLARDLSRLAKKEPAWTKKYIHSVYHERIEPSPLLARTIEALAQTVDGTPAGVAGSVWVRVLASPDMVEGTLIPAGAKRVKCARPGCPVWFVRTHPRMVYHDAECRLKR